ncbi:hypothetical protein [Opitutus terrae]|uniref:Uncharacterized protein n=1 Tax=Opitutus terrae (strain DSM 11246 / JCM 15787 / PB90-1) TaxID=452637 RepID=B1ZYX6_OPITP|nr:hypothetical protein [Opitutus terrae]ACB76299.1 hypothetical protein Oter_3019 [Opitutus terrae PB90-1]
MPHDFSGFIHSVLEQIELSPTGELPLTPAYQDALKQLYASRQVFAHADHKGGHVTARSLARLPVFCANNLAAFVAGEIAAEALESNASIFDRYVQSLPAAIRSVAESRRVLAIGKPIHHRPKHDGVIVHDPLHTVFLVPGAGPHPGLPGNYLYGAVYHAGVDESTGAWRVEVRDSDRGLAAANVPAKADAMTMLQDVLASAPFHLEELEAFGLTIT